MSNLKRNNSERFADMMQNFILNNGRFTEGYSKLVSNVHIEKKEGVITARMNNKVMMCLTPKDRENEFDFSMRFINATAMSRINAVKELLEWDDFNVTMKGTLPFICKDDGSCEALCSSKLYTKTELSLLTRA